MQNEFLTVKGMTCSGCVNHVTNAITSLPGTANVKVSLDDGLATLEFDPDVVTLAQVIAAIDEEGYTATPVSSK